MSDFVEVGNHLFRKSTINHIEVFYDCVPTITITQSDEVTKIKFPDNRLSLKETFNKLVQELTV